MKFINLRFFYGGVLGIILSVILAKYLSASLFPFYSKSILFRNITGLSPNNISGFLFKFTWICTFLGTWWMLWKLDFLLSIKVAAKGFAGNGSQNLSTNDSSERKKSSDATDASECDDPENDQFAEDGNAKQDDYKDISKPSEEELRFASILEIEQSDDPEKIKNNYRKIIAQYHPDRVRALGPEIREVAEKKAKEINEAYEYFRNKFKA